MWIILPVLLIPAILIGIMAFVLINRHKSREAKKIKKKVKRNEKNVVNGNKKIARKYDFNVKSNDSDCQI